VLDLSVREAHRGLRSVARGGILGSSYSFQDSSEIGDGGSEFAPPATKPIQRCMIDLGDLPFGWETTTALHIQILIADNLFENNRKDLRYGARTRNRTRVLLFTIDGSTQRSNPWKIPSKLSGTKAQPQQSAITG